LWVVGCGWGTRASGTTTCLAYGLCASRAVCVKFGNHCALWERITPVDRVRVRSRESHGARRTGAAYVDKSDACEKLGLVPPFEEQGRRRNVCESGSIAREGRGPANAPTSQTKDLYAPTRPFQSVDPHLTILQYL
jgi:hypothetical protein